MDKGALALLIPVLALAIGFVAILKMPRKAFGHRSDPQLEDRVDALEQELGTIRQQLIETQERLDFAERLLARTEGARQLDKG
jgi:hypothetical protein